MTRNLEGEGPARDGYSDAGSPFKPPSRRPVLHRLLPVSQQLPGYRGGTLRRDLLAGLTVAALALPAAMAYAELAGLSPVAGLYALLLPTVAYTLFGSSRQVIVGPEGSIAALAATALVPRAADDPERYGSLAALLALLVGACFLVARVIRLGWVADYFSRAVLIGYLHGVAVVLVISQLAKLLGLDIDADNPLAQLVEVARELPGLHGTTLAVGVLCLAALVLLRWRAPQAARRAARGGGRDRRLGHAGAGLRRGGDGRRDPLGAARHGAAHGTPWRPAGPGPGGAGDLLRQLLRRDPHRPVLRRPPRPARPRRHRAGRDGRGQPGRRHHPGLPHRGQRLAHRGQRPDGRPYPALGAARRRRHRRRARLPDRTDAVPAEGNPGRGHRRRRHRARRPRRLARAGPDQPGRGRHRRCDPGRGGHRRGPGGPAGGGRLSIVDVARRSATPDDAVLGWVERLGRYADVRLHPGAVVTPGVLVYRLDDRLFFANASYVKGRVREALHGAPARVRWLVFDAEALTHVDATGVDALTSLVRSLREEAITFVFARVKGPMRQALGEAGVLDLVGERHVYPTVRAAVAAATGEEQQ